MEANKITKIVIKSLKELKESSHYGESSLHMKNNVPLLIHKVIMRVKNLELTELFWDDIREENMKKIFRLLPTQKSEKWHLFKIMISKNIVNYGNIGSFLEQVDDEVMQEKMYTMLDEYLTSKTVKISDPVVV